MICVKTSKQKEFLCSLAHAMYHNGWVLVEFNAILCVGPRIIKARSLTETTYMGINSQGTSGEVKLGKKRSGSTGDQA